MFLVSQLVEVNAAPFKSSEDLKYDWYPCKILNRTSANEHANYLVQRIGRIGNPIWVDEKWVRQPV